ncbi:hypothetical protein QJ854_gp100 [Moumouvirus goulette]|uniref:Uncharacterized protein n=1 Tax=Moumouvirus goulette TaxID=1247379 RepID=M1PY23_9VIRU|nr:hypothetical protein QJ854_gp100 [Moumouvirus goulette]AGF85682.1 hypothetical protein glt_00879 [Moumouvirus goulette]
MEVTRFNTDNIMEITRYDIDSSVRRVTVIEFCHDVHDEVYDEDCDGNHYKYLANKKLGEYEKEEIDRVYNYYIRCVNYIKDHWKENYYGKEMPDTNIMKIEDLFIDHLDKEDDSVIIKTITAAHKLHDRILRHKVEVYDFNGCECGGYTPAFTGRCDCQNRRIRLTHKGLGILWIDRFSLDSKETVSIPIGY